MKKVTIQDSVGKPLCHDLTRIIPGGMKGSQFCRGHIVTADDIPMLRSMGKEHLYVWDENAGFIHEDEAALALAAFCTGSNITVSEVIREGKVELKAEVSGLFSFDPAALARVNMVKDVAIAARKNNSAVKAGETVAALRVIPVAVEAAVIEAARDAAPKESLFRVTPFSVKTAAVIATGSEIAAHLIRDAFTPVVISKLADFGIAAVHTSVVGDALEDIKIAIAAGRAVLKGHSTRGGLILCTGGMSVDPDDNTPEAIESSAAEIVTYGTPVFPGAMFMLGYFSDGDAIAGLPGCVMHAKKTVFDLVLPRIAAAVRLTKEDFAALGDGGLGF